MVLERSRAFSRLRAGTDGPEIKWRERRVSLDVVLTCAEGVWNGPIMVSSVLCVSGHGAEIAAMRGSEVAGCASALFAGNVGTSQRARDISIGEWAAIVEALGDLPLSGRLEIDCRFDTSDCSGVFAGTIRRDEQVATFVSSLSASGLQGKHAGAIVHLHGLISSLVGISSDEAASIRITA